MDAPHFQQQLTCLSCKKPTDDKARTVLQVFLCAECADYADHFRATLVKQLQWLLTVVDNAIREALLEGRLRPTQPNQPKADVPKQELLRMVEKIVGSHASHRSTDGSDSGPATDAVGGDR